MKKIKFTLLLIAPFNVHTAFLVSRYLQEQQEAMRKYDRRIRKIEELYERHSSLCHAIRNDHHAQIVEKIKDSQKRGTLHLSNLERRTALHEAALAKNMFALHQLLQAGIDSSVEDMYGMTALDWAKRSGIGVSLLQKYHKPRE